MPSHYSPERIASIRSAADTKKMQKLITKIQKGKLKEADQKKYLHISQISKVQEPEAFKAALSTVEKIAWGQFDKLPAHHDENFYLKVLDIGVPPSATVHTGNRSRNLLTLAASEGWTTLAQRLLDGGADVEANGCPYVGKPSLNLQLRPLHYTYLGGGEKMRQLLLHAGAAPLETKPSAELVKHFMRDASDILRTRLMPYRARFLEVKVPNKPGPAEESGCHSRYGGRPSLPKSEWPQGTQGPMMFVGQIVLSEMKKMPLPLPTSGVLYFFSDFPRQNGKVIFREEPSSTAAEGPMLTHGSYKMKFGFKDKGLQLPYSNCFNFREMAKASFAEAANNPIANVEQNLYESFSRQYTHHQVGGHPFLIQNDPRQRIDATVVTLLQVDQFKGEKRPLWGDNGNAQFFLRLEDLKAGNFDAAFFHWASA